MRRYRPRKSALRHPKGLDDVQICARLADLDPSRLPTLDDAATPKPNGIVLRIFEPSYQALVRSL
jgi:hypothetical protein